MFIDFAKYILCSFEGEERAGGGTGDKIEEAAAKVDKTFTVKGEEKEVEKEEIEEEEKEEEEKPTDPFEGMTDAQKRNAASLFRLLDNKDTALNTLRSIANAAGKDLTDLTKSEQKILTKTVKDIVGEELGEDYKFISDKLSNAIEKAVKTLVEQEVKPIKEKEEIRDAVEINKEITAAQDRVISTFEKVPEKVLAEANRLMEKGEVLPNSKSDPETFFKGLILTAADNLNVTLVKKPSNNTQDKRERNRTDADSRLASGNSTAKDGTVVVDKNKPRSRAEVIEAAAEKVLAKLGPPK